MNPLNIVNPSSMLFVALGGGVGCMLRFASIHAIARLNPTAFPLGTMAVNILGSLLIGMVMARYGHDHSVRAFFVTGVLGGYTTFSAYSWDAMQLLQRGQTMEAALYIIGSVALSLVAVFIGWNLVRGM